MERNSRTGPDRLREPWKRRFWGGLFFCIGLLLFVVFFRPYALEGDMGIKIIICPFRNLTGLPCPGCGLTRAVYHLAHGDFRQAFACHIFAPAFFLLVFAEIINSIVGIARKGKPLFWWSELFSHRILKVPAYLFVISVVVYNIYRIWVIVSTAPSVGAAVSDSIICRVIRLVSHLM
jgi:hypothetical protein